MSSEETDQPPPHDDEKGHTFRKRRLTIPMHQLELDVVEAAVAEVEAQAQVEAQVDDPDADPTDPTDTPAPTATDQPLFDEKEKSKTFRKRRLTLTKHQITADIAAAAGFADASDEEEPPSPERKKRRVSERRMSDVSHTSTVSSSAASGFLQSKIHHAGEILRVPPSPSAARADSRLYTGPHNLDQYQPEDRQPVWKRRMTRRHSDDETKLLFPRHIVGQYSCHGVEPMYESDYEPVDEEEDDDDDWLNEIPHQDGTNGDANANGANGMQRQPKATTSAKTNQDRGGIAFPYGNSPRTALFAVYDGHGQGGELVSQYALHHVQQKLKRHANFADNLEKAFQETFITVDEELKLEPTIEPLYAGTTACVALLRENVLTISNAGDSRAVVARLLPDNKTGWETIQLSQDQNPDNPEEQARIEYHGGFVSPPPEPGLSARVWLDKSCTQIGLAMSRSIGDHAVKPVGVVAEPVVTSHVVTKDDDFMILASDGVWEFITSEEAVKIVGSHLSMGASKACQALIEAAANKWHEEEGDYRDDITALVIRLQNVWDDILN